jgi:hypothetical protein
MESKTRTKGHLVVNTMESHQLCVTSNCKQPCAISEHTGLLSKRCQKCLEKHRKATSKSYYRRIEKVKECSDKDKKLADRNEEIWQLKREIGALRERLTLCNAAKKKSEDSLKKTQTSLAEAVEAANFACKKGKLPESANLPCSVSIRNEAVVINKINSLDAKIEQVALDVKVISTDLNEKYHRQVTDIIESMEDMNNEFRKTIDHFIHKMK